MRRRSCDCAARGRPCAGFTLAELLVAVTLITLVMTAVYTLFNGAVRVLQGVDIESGGQVFEANREARNFFALFEHELANLERSAAHLLEGDSDELTMFVVSEPMQVEKYTGRHLMRVRYRFNRSGGKILREEALAEMSLPARPPRGRELDRARVKVKHEEEFEVVSGVKNLEIRYVWMPRPKGRPHDQPPAWVTPLRVPEHRERWGLPQGVEVTLVLENPRRPEEVEAVTALFPIYTPGYLMSIEELNRLFQGET